MKESIERVINKPIYRFILEDAETTREVLRPLPGLESDKRGGTRPINQKR